MTRQSGKLQLCQSINERAKCNLEILCSKTKYYIEFRHRYIFLLTIYLNVIVLIVLFRNFMQLCYYIDETYSGNFGQ